MGGAQDVPEGLTLEKIWDDRMLNVSYNMPHVKQKMVVLSLPSTRT